MRRALRLLLLLCLGFGAAQAQSPAPTPSADTIPPVLRDWRSWVLKNQEFRACPLISGSDANEAGSYVCAWPGRLGLDADAAGLRFVQQWRVDTPSWIGLPGDADNWPQDVQVDGQPAAVLEREGEPQLRLGPGVHRIEGRISWVQRPQQLQVPQTIALVDLRVDGKPVLPLERNGEQLTLGRGEASEPQADEISIEVFRKLSDDIPARLETRLRLHVSGQAREESVGPVLPPGFLPLALQGGITARLSNDGRLHMQVQPGDWDLSLTARATAPLLKVVLPAIEQPWPAQEIWSFEAVSWLRVGTARAEQSIDPAQAGVPAEWRNLPAFALAANGELAVEEQSRGLSSVDANRLHLQRDVWLQFDGAAMYAKDRVSGSMNRDWRLDVAAPYVLERAESGGEGLLVTQSGQGLTGVELRESAVNLGAGVRIGTRKGELPIAGWQQSFDSINWSLHLPYSYRLLAAPGADRAGDSWIARWSLLDVFLVAVTALLAARLLGWLGGGLVLGYLILGYHENNSPLWTLLSVIALGLVAKALPAGRLRDVVRWVTVLPAVLLAVWGLLFVAQQVRYTLYPQLEGESGWSEPFQASLNAPPPIVTEEASPMSVPAPAAPPPPPQMANDGYLSNYAKGESSGGAPSSRSLARQKARVENNAVQRYAQNTVIQAGRGEPSWNYGRVYSLSWSGPVLAEQTVRLVISPPWLTRLLRIGMLALLLVTLAMLARRYWAARTPSPSVANAAGLGAAGWLLALSLASPLAPAQAQGTLPDQAMLDQLRQRLTEAPPCLPDCAKAARVEIRLANDTLAVMLEVHAGERVAVPLPVVDGSVALQAVRIDGVAAETVVRHDEQDWLALDRGVHRITLDYRVVDSDHAALKFVLAPAQVRLDLNGWQAVGVSENRLLGDTVTLSRERDASSSGPARGGAQQFPPYVQVERSLAFDLEWRVLTTVRRLAPAEGGFSVRVPLLPGEQVMSSDTKVEAGQVLLSFGADESETSWNSTLARGEAVDLVAPALADRAEVWSVVLSPTWHAEFSGLPEARAQAPSGQWVHEFHPLPEEKLHIALSRPDAVVGKSIAIDDVAVTTEASKRALDTTLEMSLRSTQGGEHSIVLPEGAEVLSVAKNGQPMNLRPRDNKLSLPVTPGSNRFVVQLRQAQELGLRTRTPAFDLGLPSANLRLNLSLPADRWVLFTHGPMVGPAVLYWGELIIMIVFAYGISRLRRTPLKLWQWLLLGFGFSTASWWALLVVVAWLFLLDWRERWQTFSPVWFNLVQVGIVLFSVPAMLCLVAAVCMGLLGDPDMSVSGNGSYARALHWFADQSANVLPQAGALTLPLWLHRLAMLAWALWLASALVAWLRWAFAAWTHGGYWRSGRRETVSLPDPPPPPAQT
ncbi:hypothetical protein DFR29_103235 [Tahibacter aquaticus]|uniref:Uncharacterized protein n=1 Tax=Tahibacter aquaticus TaxID=520092 RepID=A0A4R6Z560_9GAMM|nr:hypothetical protein [Tahibacter aquaticus]TDR46699.1 hypothetical protein DFR29_103235 [Tahibacter aquaticus]